ncbi:hypothetical protein ACFV9D_07360 [Streptomyces sp. NPDC059875]|uniref:hypothetical protein n=1 Tax=unclassified Streptomyces TaxID=2593676 RepID=UPI003665EA22
MPLDDGLRFEKRPCAAQLIEGLRLFGEVGLSGGAGRRDGEGLVIIKICHGVTPN